MTTSVSCSWCHTLTAETYCPSCQHRADVARLDCDCDVCRRCAPPADPDSMRQGGGPYRPMPWEPGYDYDHGGRDA